MKMQFYSVSAVRSDISKRAIDFVLRGTTIFLVPYVIMEFVGLKLALYVAKGGWEMYVIFLLQDCLEKWKLMKKSTEKTVSQGVTIGVVQDEVEHRAG